MRGASTHHQRHTKALTACLLMILSRPSMFCNKKNILPLYLGKIVNRLNHLRGCNFTIFGHDF